MRLATLVLALSLVLMGLAATPTASASDRCVAGDDMESCAVGVQFIVCVTEPCDGLKVCAGYGLVCV